MQIPLSHKGYLELNPSKKALADLDENTLVSFVEMAGVSNDGYIQTQSPKPLKELKKGGYTYFAQNDIIIAKITPCMENGKCALATDLTNGIGLGSTEFHVFRAKEGLLPKFLFLCLNQEAIRQEAAKHMTGASGHRRVPMSFYEALKIPLPPLQAQEQIVGVIAKIQQERTALENTLRSLEGQQEATLKKYLHPDT
ncbi:hypothetical protein NHP20013_11230 [Helicobacter bizzozeronii]|nr:hypothetical protein NHP20013_11230 [Helicobacter bizzozeronii]